MAVRAAVRMARLRFIKQHFLPADSGSAGAAMMRSFTPAATEVDVVAERREKESGEAATAGAPVMVPPLTSAQQLVEMRQLLERFRTVYPDA